MLSPSDEAFLDVQAYSVDHDYFYLPTLLGEPFLSNGILSFFDGSAVHIMGSAIPWDPVNAHQQIASVVEQWIMDERVEFVNYFGPARPDWPLLETFTIVYSADCLAHNVELFVDLSLMPSMKVARKQRQDLGRARRRGIEVRTTRLPYLSHRHITLLRSSMQRNDYGVSDASYVVNVPAILGHSSTMVFEAVIGDRLVGFGVTHEFFRGRPFFLAAAFDRAAPGCSDALYGAIIRYYRETGAKTLSLGYASSPENMRYKLKWGGMARTPPCFQLILRRRDCRTPFRESLHWPWRILVDVWST
jgi:hypothetical protein